MKVTAQSTATNWAATSKVGRYSRKITWHSATVTMPKHCVMPRYVQVAAHSVQNASTFLMHLKMAWAQTVVPFIVICLPLPWNELFVESLRMIQFLPWYSSSLNPKEEFSSAWKLMASKPKWPDVLPGAHECYLYGIRTEEGIHYIFMRTCSLIVITVSKTDLLYWFLAYIRT